MKLTICFNFFRQYQWNLLIKVWLINIILTGLALAQDAEYGIGSAERYHKQFIKQQMGLFDELFAGYETFIANHPDDVIARVELCRFAYLLAYDEYEEYVLIQKAHEWSEMCLTDLQDVAPMYPEVQLLALDNVYGEAALTYYQNLVEMGFEGWSVEQIRRALFSTANNTYWMESEAVGLLASDAAANNIPNLAVNLRAAKYYFENENHAQALTLLNTLTFSDDDKWQASNKLSYLIEYRYYDEANAFYDVLKNEYKVSPSVNDLVKLHIGLLDSDQAIISAKDQLNSGSRVLENAKSYFEFALKNGDENTAKVFYELFRDQSYSADPFLYQRWQLYQLFPNIPFSMQDALRLFNWFLVILACVLIPLLLILPVHYWSLLKQRSGKSVKSFVGTWNLKHAWLVLAAFIFVDVIGSFIWSYDALWALLFSNNDWIGTVLQKDVVNSVVFTDVTMLAVLMLLLRKNGSLFGKGHWSWGKLAGVVFVTLICLRVLAVAIVGIETSGEFILQVSQPYVRNAVFAFHEYYGLWGLLLSFAVITPIVEELLFRGVLLSALSKHVHFFWANLLQSLLFAFSHDDIRLLLFFIVFGLTAGYMTKHSKRLLPSILLHGVNNALFCIAVIHL